MSDFEGTSPNGTWTLSVTDYSSNGATVMHNWELYIDSSAP